MATDYSKKTNAELVEILKSRSLPHTGKKAEMVARLQEDDANKAKSEAAAAPAPSKTDNTTEDVIDWEDDDVPAAEAAAAKPAAEPAAGTVAAGEKPQPETTATAAADAPQAESQGAADKQESAGETGAAATAAEEKPAPNYTIGLPITEMEEELKKRKARAEKFGITEESKAAIAEAERKLERAKRFGTGAGEQTEVGVGRLDEALPSEKPRKRGRDNDQGGRGGKRRDVGGRSRFQRRGRGGNQNGRGQGQAKSNGNASHEASSGLSEKDRQAMEARKKRFGTAA